MMLQKNLAASLQFPVAVYKKVNTAEQVTWCDVLLSEYLLECCLQAADVGALGQLVCIYLRVYHSGSLVSHASICSID